MSHEPSSPPFSTSTADPLYLAYEHQAVRYLEPSYKEVHHWSRIPEDVLKDSGFIHNFNEHRLQRLNAMKAGMPEGNHVREYGLDAIAFDGQSYHGVQCKRWDAQRTLTASDLGTFISVIYMRMRMHDSKATGILVTPARLQIDLRDDMQNGGAIQVVNLIPENEGIHTDAASATDAADAVNAPDAADARDTAGAAKSKEPPLYPPQVEALEAIQKWYDKPYNTREQHETSQPLPAGNTTGDATSAGDSPALLSMPCGMGKTRVLSEFLKSRLAAHPTSVVILVSPFRVQAEQIIGRVGIKYLPNHRQIIVDSDAQRAGDVKNGKPLRTTNVDKLRHDMFDMWGRLKRACLISTTFASLVNVIEPYLFTNEKGQRHARDYVLVIDEAHNITCEAARVATNASNHGIRTLLITATPGKVMQSRFEDDFLNTVYSFSMKEAIEEKYVCDYNIVIPELVLETEEEGGGEGRDGTTRNAGTSSSSRKRKRARLTTRINMELPEELQDSYKQLTEPKKLTMNETSYEQLALQCLFLANGMMKYGCRRCIVFCSSMEKCTEFCDVFKVVCAAYHGIRYVFAKSIVSSTAASKRDKILTEFETYMTNGAPFLCILANVRILSEGVNVVSCDSVFLTSAASDPEGITSIQRLCRANRIDPNHPGKVAYCFVWADDADKTAIALHTLKYASGGVGSGSSSDQAEKEGMESLARRIHMLKNEYGNDHGDNSQKSRCHDKSVPHAKRRPSPVQTGQCAQEWLEQKIENVKCVGVEDRWRMQFKVLQTFLEHSNGKKPRQTCDDPNEKQLAAWLYTQQRNWAQKEGIMKCEKIYAQWEEFITENTDLMTYHIKGWESSLGIARAFLADHNRFPSLTSEDVHEMRIALWIRAQHTRHAQKPSGLMALSSIRCQWSKFLTECAELFEDDPFVWEATMEEVQAFISQRDTRPSSASGNADEKRLVKWISAQQYKYISTTGIMQDPNFRAQWSAFLKKNEAFYEDNISVWKRTFTEVQQFIRANNRRPVPNGDGDEARLAQWILAQEWSYAHKAFFMRNEGVRAQWEQLTQVEHAALFEHDTSQAEKANTESRHNTGGKTREAQADFRSAKNKCKPTAKAPKEEICVACEEMGEVYWSDGLRAWCHDCARDLHLV